MAPADTIAGVEHEFGVGDPDVVVDIETSISAPAGRDAVPLATDDHDVGFRSQADLDIDGFRADLDTDGSQADLDTDGSQCDVDIDGSVLDAIEQELADVERALVLLDEGTYGLCEACGTAIEDAVLARAPAARLCADHLPLSSR